MLLAVLSIRVGVYGEQANASVTSLHVPYLWPQIWTAWLAWHSPQIIKLIKTEEFCLCAISFSGFEYETRCFRHAKDAFHLNLIFLFFSCSLLSHLPSTPTCFQNTRTSIKWNKTKKMERMVRLRGAQKRVAYEKWNVLLASGSGLFCIDRAAGSASGCYEECFPSVISFCTISLSGVWL